VAYDYPATIYSREIELCLYKNILTTKLADGRIFVVDSTDAEIYDPTPADNWSKAGSMKKARFDLHSAILKL